MNETMQGGMSDNKPKVCSCPHHKVTPTIFLIIGLIYLIEAFGWLSLTPTVGMAVVGILFIIIGCMKMMGKKCKCC